MTEQTPKRRFPILREIDDHGPVFFLLLMAYGLVHYEAANVMPDRYLEAGIPVWKYALTAIFPAFWFVTYYYFRARNAQVKRPRLFFFCMAALGIGLPILAYFGARPRHLTDHQIVVIYEYSQFVWLGLLVINALRKKGLARAITFFGVCFLYGLTLEKGGIMLRFFGESHYQWYIGLNSSVYLPAPVATQFGWCIMFYVAVWIAEFIGSRIKFLAGKPILLALLATIVGVTLDLQIDPLASLSGLWWKWDPRLPGWWLGVPFLNYAAWFSAFLPFCYAYFYYESKKDMTDWQRAYQILVRVPWMLPACIALGAPLMLLYEGVRGPAFQIMLEFLKRVHPYA